jgi:peptide/nickel transport system substrate-binding protein
MSDETGWRHFRRIKLNHKAITRHMKRVEGVTIRHAHKFIIKRWDNIREVRRHIIVWLVGVGLLIAVIGGQIVWFQQGYLMTAPIAGGVYAEAVNGPVDTLDPLYASSGAEIAASKLLFSSLFDYDATGHLRNDLGTSLQVDPTGIEYTVTFRPSVKWHDGQPVTVDDVIFTTQLMKDPAVRATASLRSIWKDVAVTPIAQNTIKFTLPNPNAAFPQALTFAILPKHILQNIQPNMIRESSFSTSPVGSGPFQMKRLQLVNESEGRKIIHMAAFANYYKGAPKLSRFQLHIYGSTKAILTALRTNEVNAAADLGVFDLSQINKAHYTVLTKPVNSGVYALFNTSQPPLSDKLVRQALQAATNTSEVRQSVGGNYHSMDLPFADSQLLGGNAPRAPAFDTKRAANLLDQAGWILNGQVRMKAGVPLKLRVVTVQNEAYEHALNELSDQWRRIGVQTVIMVVDPSNPNIDFTQNILQKRAYDVLINRLNIGADPDVYAYWHSSQTSINDSNPLGKNYSNYSNSISDTALSGALTRMDPVQRDVRYRAFAKQWLDDAPAVGLYQSNMYYVHSKNTQTLTDDEKIVAPIDRYGGVIYWTVDHGMVYKTP